LFALVACDKKSEVLDTTVAIQKAPKTTDVMLDSIAKIICYISDNKTVQNEVLEGINDNLYFGLDEDLRLIDILFPNESKIIRNKQSILTLTKLLRNVFRVNPNSKIVDNLNNPLVEYVVKNDIHIYFPYSRNITGMPTIVVRQVIDGEENKNEFDNPFRAYKKTSKVNAFELMISDKLMEEVPLWIITKNEMPYEDLPDFVGGIFEKNGVRFVTRFDTNDLLPLADEEAPGVYNDPSKIYAIYIGNVKCTERYDVGHGPELRFKFITAKIVANDTIKQTYTVARYDFTKKEVADGTIKTNFTQLIDDWKTESVYGGFSVFEEDPGYKNERDIPIELTVTNYFNFKTTIPIGKYDDEIYTTSMDRSSYFSLATTDIGNGMRGGWPVMAAGSSVSFVLKYIIVDRVY
jgi:hypothetical protein